MLSVVEMQIRVLDVFGRHWPLEIETLVQQCCNDRGGGREINVEDAKVEELVLG